MIGRMLTVAAVGVSIVVVGTVIGAADSSFRHYYRRFAEEEDLRTNQVQEVVIVKDETKKTRGKK